MRCIGKPLIIMKFRKIENIKSIRTTDCFVGQSIEEKVFQAVNTNAPIEAVAPMVYTERKEGVLPETNIRTDRFEIAQEAMNSIATGTRKKRLEKQFENIDKQAGDSGNSTTQSDQN